MIDSTGFGYGRKIRKADKIAAELDAVKKHDADNALKPAAIVAWAKAHPRSDLYKQFPWDDSKAAHLYRLDVARHIIRAYVEIVHQDVQEVRAVISLPSDRGKQGVGYRSTKDILKNQVWRTELIGMAKRDMRLFKAKYGILKELSDIFEAMDKFLK